MCFITKYNIETCLWFSEHEKFKYEYKNVEALYFRDRLKTLVQGSVKFHLHGLNAAPI